MEEEQLSTTSRRPSGSRGGILIMVVLAAIMISMFVVAIKWRTSLKVERIVIEGAQNVPAKEIFALTQVPRDAQMYDVELAEVLERVLRQPFVKSAEICRQYPDKLEIQILERKPVASISCGVLRYVDADGVMLPGGVPQHKFDLPLISGINGLQNVEPGKTILNKEIYEAIEICQTAQSLDSAIGGMISEINMNEGGEITLYSVDGGIPILLGRGDIERKLVTLEYFWNTFVATRDINTLKCIDLRFEDQVVVKWAGNPGGQVNEISS